MTVLITLTAAGTDTGPFDLYSDVDSYTIPFETGITKAALLSGYTSAVVPDYTGTIKVKSEGACVNFVEISLVYPTTTTTTTAAPFITPGGHSYQANEGEPCDEAFYPYTIGATFPPPLGFTLMFTPDVAWSDIEYVEIMSVTPAPGLEIRYNGVIVAPGDILYPTSINAWVSSMTTTRSTVDCTDISEVWGVRVKLFGYDISNITSFTTYYIESQCLVCATTTTTTTVAPTTTTTTTLAYATWDVSTLSNASAVTACTYAVDQNLYAASVPTGVANIAVLYTDSALTTPFVGNTLFYRIREGASFFSMNVDASGNVTNVTAC